MNSLISPASSIILPLSQLSPHCNRLLTCLHDDRTSQKERILYEQTLWNEVKKIRVLNDKSLFLYLIGYYHAILIQATKLTAQHDLFQYHVLIRLGDLNRYMERNEVAAYYYCNARNIFPFFGQAYNQLGLLIKPVNCYKCCYYYARAARSSDKPLNTIADSNLRIAVTKYNCKLLNHILNDDTSISLSGSKDQEVLEPESLPESACGWFYIIVIAIYADNIQTVTKLFLNYLNENFSIQKATIKRDNLKKVDIYCDRKSYILLASLDILLDWLKFGNQGKAILSSIGPELRQIRASLQTIISQHQSSTSNQLEHFHQQASLNNNNHDVSPNLTIMDTSLSITHNSNSTMYSHSSTTNSSEGFTNHKLPALPHDYVLRGFKPLDVIHQDLDFKTPFKTKGSLECASIDNNDEKLIDTGQLIQIIERIKCKMEAFWPLVRKKTRNIALESIMSIRDQV